ncbi:hypothetical protein DXT93_32105 [Agrobacterium rhizogenes]|nr:hypothetical protein [Rhizobium rhizogenes]
MNDAPASVLPMSVNEMHLFAYLACIFALFKGEPVGEWGYPFAITTEGFPFSAQLDAAREVLYVTGRIELDDEGLMIPRPIELAHEFNTILSLGSWANRRRWLQAATECALALPMGSIRYAVSRSPGMASSFFLGRRGQLLEPIDTALLYEEYKVVSSVLGTDASDVLSPAVLWLSARIMRKGDDDV